MAKKSKIEKQTRRIISAISDMVKKKDGRYKFKTKKKKLIKKAKATCVHWIIRKGKEHPTLKQDQNDPTFWRCSICGCKFPIQPLKKDYPKHNPYHDKVEEMLGLVNQIQFYAVKLGGDAEDTKMFLRLRKDLPQFSKVAKQVLKRVEQRNEYENNRNKNNVMSQFGNYSSYSYK